MTNNTKVDLLEFKVFVDNVIREELENYSNNELNDFVQANISYNILSQLAYKDFIKGYHITAKDTIINEVFYN